jgi:hypothetical protein
VDPRKNRDSNRRHIIVRDTHSLTMGSKLRLQASAFWLGKEDIDFVVFIPLSPDYFPGPGVSAT